MSHAAHALGQSRDPRTVEPLVQLIRARSFALGRLKDRRAVFPLIAALQDGDMWVRVQAAYSLGLLADIRALEPLRRLAEDDPARLNGAAKVRAAALDALDQIERAANRIGA